jgi:hypothetical protein
MGWLLNEHTIDWTIKNFTDEWFIEHKDANTQIIESFYRPGGPPVGHFTLMVNDKQSRGINIFFSHFFHLSTKYSIFTSWMWPCKIYETSKQLELQGARYDMQLQLDKCIHLSSL